MPVHYDFYENPPKPESTKPVRLHARVVAGKTVDTEKLSEEIHARSSLTTSDVQAALISLKELIQEHLQAGDRIHISGLGTFEMTLSCPDIRDSHEIRAESVRFKSIAFRPEKELKRKLETTRFVRSRQKKHSRKYTENEIEARLAEYLGVHDFISSTTFQSLCKQTKTTANRILKALVGQGKLIRSGLHRFPVYVKGEKAHW